MMAILAEEASHEAQRDAKDSAAYRSAFERIWSRTQREVLRIGEAYENWFDARLGATPAVASTTAVRLFRDPSEVT